MGVLGDIIWRVLKTRPFESLRPRIYTSFVHRLKGKARPSGSILSAIVFGPKVNVEYFSKLIYSGDSSVEYVGKQTFSDFAFSARSELDDLTVVVTSWYFARFLDEKGFFVSPRLDFVLDIGDSLEVIQSRFSDSKQREVRKIIKTGYTYEITKDPAETEYFFNEIYLPHILNRYGKSALPMSFPEYKKKCLEGDLVLIKLGQETVSGTVLVSCGDELHGPIVAVKDVDKQLSLGSTALYYYSVILGIKKGFTQVDFGETVPFMRDGLFQYKKKFGMRIRPAKGSTAQVFGIKFSKMSEAVTGFLSANPFIFMDGEALSGLVFVECIADLSESFFVPGLSSLYIISSDVFCSVWRGLKLEKISTDSFSNQKDSVLNWLTQICAKEGYCVYGLDCKNRP